ncbi:VPLPA-CTERM sorting domain-containing protein [Tateyamaria sp. Alg231-49]|uniref:VPLPA-CTERM sorting domain-containing protein n=1 Tax=Tateyamaria sp. Alg231-49 TaxID=1922219 RepID=UPI000D562484|nr:VPLPA-CTERM sorting domain-containing protein [Tateyamaria sp. Alg231-49]
MSLKSLLVAGAIALASTSLHAATVSEVGTFAGGTDFVSSGSLALVSSLHPRYEPNSSTSEWVWDVNLALSPVTFSHKFDLTGFDISTASLSGVWGVDNIGKAYLNGAEISSITFGVAAFETLTAYGSTSGFVDGLNTLSFVVENTGSYSGPNPAAFRAEALIQATPVPLPAALPLLIAAIAGLGFAGRRRRRAAV